MVELQATDVASSDVSALRERADELCLVIDCLVEFLGRLVKIVDRLIEFADSFAGRIRSLLLVENCAVTALAK